jgi:hypothetical protein
MTVTVEGLNHHLISYYTVNDIVTERLHRPSQVVNLCYIRPRVELESGQFFRLPLQEENEYENRAKQRQQYGVSMLAPGFLSDSQYPMQGYCMLVQHPYSQSQHVSTSDSVAARIPATYPLPSVRDPKT